TRNEFTAQTGGVKEDCQELFFSEFLTFGNSDVIEIFNPSSSNINLSFYKLELVSSSSVVTSIPISGIIPAKGTWVICNAKANAAVIAKADQTSSSLNFSKNVTARLMNGTTVIDIFGEASSAVFTPANLIAFLNDPVNFCAVNKIALSTLTNVDMRRGMFTTHGDTSFCSVQVFGKWGIFPGNDYSNLGTHYGVCNRDPKAGPIVGYAIPMMTLHEDPMFSMSVDNLDINVSGNDASFHATSQDYTAGSAVANVDICFFACSHPDNCSLNLVADGVQANCTYAHTTGNLFTGTRNKTIKMTSVASDYTVDFATQSHLITIIGDQMAGVQEYSAGNLTLKTFPNPAQDVLNIETSDGGSYNIYSADGALVKSDTYKANSQINISSLNSGLYLIYFKNEKGYKIQKITKN
ncbi:MAG TPA: T9SS type A sorting domain-containing protein, partial [Bacteroidia bacterium]|nr:T9SS type A sorting domain-containing protein [Bacteroidia bacterium]